MPDCTPRLFLPEGRVDAPRAPRPLRPLRPALPEVLVRGAGRSTVVRPAPVEELAPTTPTEPTWVCSLRAAQDLVRHLGIDVPPDIEPRKLRETADEIVRAARKSCVLAGRSGQGSDVYALPRGIRRIGLVMASGADRPGVRTIVCALSAAKMEEQYPTDSGEPRDWQVLHERGMLALQVLDDLAEEAGPDSQAARMRDLVRGSSFEEVRAMLGRPAGAEAAR
jgi:hypothetical protein